jgi:hypothetical protein
MNNMNNAFPVWTSYDDTTGFGPEITRLWIRDLPNGYYYRFIVHKYAKEDERINASPVTVALNHQGVNLDTFHLDEFDGPEDAPNFRWWYVFDLGKDVDGNPSVVTINQLGPADGATEWNGLNVNDLVHDQPVFASGHNYDIADQWYDGAEPAPQPQPQPDQGIPGVYPWTIVSTWTNPTDHDTRCRYVWNGIWEVFYQGENSKHGIINNYSDSFSGGPEGFTFTDPNLFATHPVRCIARSLSSTTSQHTMVVTDGNGLSDSKTHTLRYRETWYGLEFGEDYYKWHEEITGGPDNGNLYVYPDWWDNN